VIPPAESVTTDIATDPPSAHPVPAPRSHFGNGFLAAAASLWLAGLGHVLARDPRRAVKWFAAVAIWMTTYFLAAAVPSLVPALIVIVPLGMLLMLACVVDAWRTGRRAEVPRFGTSAMRVIIGIVFLAAAAVAPAALPLALLLRAKIVEAFVMPSASMSPTLLPGDRFAVHKVGRPYRRWDVVAFHFPGNPELKWVMRIAGMPGERLEIVNGVVTIDGRAVPQPSGIAPYTEDERMRRIRGQDSTGCDGNPITLGPDEFFMLGDDSPIANDSRRWNHAAPGHQLGALPAGMIIGRATWTYWPPSRWKNLEPKR